jgi:hypothetical protein
LAQHSGIRRTVVNNDCVEIAIRLTIQVFEARFECLWAVMRWNDN